MNNWSGLGRITRDLEVRYSQNNNAVLPFTIAIDRKFKDSSGERQTDFINCVAFGKTAEHMAKWFTKGSMIAVTGAIQTRRYSDKNGENRTVTEVVVDEVSFTGERRDNAKQGATEYREASSNYIPDDDDDQSDLPF